MLDLIFFKIKIEMKKIPFFISLMLTLLVILIFIFCPHLLTFALDKNNSIPLGTFITWLGFISYTLTFYFGIKRLQSPKKSHEKVLAYVLKSIIFLAILWIPISYLLAGNMTFTFTESITFQGGQQAMKLFWYFIYFLTIGPLVISSIYGIYKLFIK